MSGTGLVPDGAAERRRLTQPLGGLLVLGGSVVAFSTVLGVAGTLSGSGFGFSSLWFGQAPVCADVNINDIGVNGSGPSLTGLLPDASVSVPNPLSVCVQHATSGQRALAFLAGAPNTVYFLVIFAVVAWLLLVARREGAFAPRVHKLLRFLGWFVIIGSVVAGIGRNLADAYFLASVTTEHVPIAFDTFGNMTLDVQLLAGCALLTLARIMRAGTRMREDLEGTV